LKSGKTVFLTNRLLVFVLSGSLKIDVQCYFMFFFLLFAGSKRSKKSRYPVSQSPIHSLSQSLPIPDFQAPRGHQTLCFRIV